MANIKSAQKKNRQRIKKEARNRSQRSALRTAVKRVRAAVAAKNPTEAKAALGAAISLVDRAGRKGVIERNASARVVSRLVRAVNTAPTAKAAPAAKASAKPAAKAAAKPKAAPKAPKAAKTAK